MLFAPKRMWMKPSHFFLPCRPQTTPRATKRTIQSRRLWNGYYAYWTRKLPMTACLGEHTFTCGQSRPLVSLNCLYLTTRAPNFRENIPKPNAYLKTRSSFILLLQHSDEIIHSYVFTAYGQKLVWFRGRRGSLYKQEACMWSVRTTSGCRPLPVIRNGNIQFQIPTDSTRSPEDEGRIFLLKRRWQKSVYNHLNNTCRKSLKTYINCKYFSVSSSNN